MVFNSRSIGLNSLAVIGAGTASLACRFLCFGMHRIDGSNFMLLTDVFLLWLLGLKPFDLPLTGSPVSTQSKQKMSKLSNAKKQNVNGIEL